MDEIYLDNAATSRLFPAAREAMDEAVRTAYANPSSRHSLGLRAARVVEGARETVARAIAADPGEIVFTGGGSEANNLALKGAAWAYARAGKHFVVSAVEHPSVLETAKWLEGQGLEVSFVRPGPDGRVEAAAVLAAVTPETIGVSLMHVNNEVGAIQPVREVGRGLAARRDQSGRRRGLPLFHVDAVQSLGRLPVDVAAIGADLVSLSAHKVHGPKGVGALFVRRGVRLVPLIHGGGHEHGRRSGTENVPGIAGFGAALAELQAVGLAEVTSRLALLRARLLEVVREDLGGAAVVNGPETDVAPHILSLSFPGIPAEVLQHHLEGRGVYVSTGSACSSHHQGRRSHVFEAMGAEAAVADSAIRLSFSILNTPDEAEKTGRAVVASVRELARGRGTGPR